MRIPTRLSSQQVRAGPCVAAFLAGRCAPRSRTIACMYGKLRSWWPVLKWVLCLVVAFFIGWRFYKDLARLNSGKSRSIPTGFSWAAFFIYSASAAVRSTGGVCRFPATEAAACRRAAPTTSANSASTFQARRWPSCSRPNLIRPAGVRPGLCTLTSFYEVLTTMASGALVACILFGLFGRDMSTSADGEVLGGSSAGPAGRSDLALKFRCCFHSFSCA